MAVLESLPLSGKLLASIMSPLLPSRHLCFHHVTSASFTSFCQRACLYHVTQILTSKSQTWKTSVQGAHQPEQGGADRFRAAAFEPLSLSGELSRLPSCHQCIGPKSSSDADADDVDADAFGVYALDAGVDGYFDADAVCVYAFDAGVDGYSDTDVVDADADADAFGVYAFDEMLVMLLLMPFVFYAFDAGIGVYSGADVVDADAGADVLFIFALESCGKRFHI